jgi:hypothetical protein
MPLWFFLLCFVADERPRFVSFFGLMWWFLYEHELLLWDRLFGFAGAIYVLGGFHEVPERVHARWSVFLLCVLFDVLFIFFLGFRATAAFDPSVVIPLFGLVCIPACMLTLTLARHLWRCVKACLDFLYTLLSWFWRTNPWVASFLFACLFVVLVSVGLLSIGSNSSLNSTRNTSAL